MYDDEWMCVPIVLTENRPEQRWCKWIFFFWAHVQPTSTTINVGDWREEYISSIDTLGGDTTLRSHCGVKKDIPILQFVWHLVIKWVCLSMLLIKGPAFTFFSFRFWVVRRIVTLKGKFHLMGQAGVCEKGTNSFHRVVVLLHASLCGPPHARRIFQGLFWRLGPAFEP